MANIRFTKPRNDNRIRQAKDDLDHVTVNEANQSTNPRGEKKQPPYHIFITSPSEDRGILTTELSPTKVPSPSQCGSGTHHTFRGSRNVQVTETQIFSSPHSAQLILNQKTDVLMKISEKDTENITFPNELSEKFITETHSDLNLEKYVRDELIGQRNTSRCMQGSQDLNKIYVEERSPNKCTYYNTLSYATAKDQNQHLTDSYARQAITFCDKIRDPSDKCDEMNNEGSCIASSIHDITKCLKETVNNKKSSCPPTTIAEDVVHGHCSTPRRGIENESTSALISHQSRSNYITSGHIVSAVYSDTKNLKDSDVSHNAYKSDKKKFDLSMKPTGHDLTEQGQHRHISVIEPPGYDVTNSGPGHTAPTEHSQVISDKCDGTQHQGYDCHQTELKELHANKTTPQWKNKEYLIVESSSCVKTGKSKMSATDKKENCLQLHAGLDVAKMNTAHSPNKAEDLTNISKSGALSSNAKELPSSIATDNSASLSFSFNHRALSPTLPSSDENSLKLRPSKMSKTLILPVCIADSTYVSISSSNEEKNINSSKYVASWEESAIKDISKNGQEKVRPNSTNNTDNVLVKNVLNLVEKDIHDNIFFSDSKVIITTGTAYEEIKDRGPASSKEMKNISPACNEIKDIGPTSKEMKEIGRNGKEMINNGTAGKEIKNANSVCKEKINTDSTCKEMKDISPVSKEMKDISPVSKEMKDTDYVSMLTNTAFKNSCELLNFNNLSKSCKSNKTMKMETVKNLQECKQDIESKNIILTNQLHNSDTNGEKHFYNIVSEPVNILPDVEQIDMQKLLLESLSTEITTLPQNNPNINQHQETTEHKTYIPPKNQPSVTKTKQEAVRTDHFSYPNKRLSGSDLLHGKLPFKRSISSGTLSINNHGTSCFRRANDFHFFDKNEIIDSEEDDTIGIDLDEMFKQLDRDRSRKTVRCQFKTPNKENSLPGKNADHTVSSEVTENEQTHDTFRPVRESVSCDRLKIRRCALADPLRMIMSQESRERLERDVERRRQSLVRKLSQFINIQLGLNKEEDLI